MTPTDPSRAILSRYPSAVAGLDWTPLGSAGGFSGARIWRGDLAGQPAFALKAWPPGYPADRLAVIHSWMADARPTGLVPAVVPTLSNDSCVEHAGRVWDVTAWVPGAADFRRDPTDARLAAACAALAALHRCWAPPTPTLAPCPGVLRRLAVLDEYASHVGPRRLGPTYKTALDLLAAHVPAAIADLRPWADRPVPIFPCLCDVWHDHVFFTDERVSGIIDYGAMKTDHPAVDLARLLGDLTDGDPDRVRLGLDAYRAAGGPVPIDPHYVTVLDRTGLVCAVIHWVNRPELARSGDSKMSGRMSHLIDRLAAR
jgi:homoserine kinase type II